MSSTYDYKYVVKFIVIGDMGVGKSCILRQFLDKRFLSDSPHTIGVEFATKIIDVGSGTSVKLQIWDTAGQERFRSVTRSYYRGAAATILVYDITRRSTFTHLSNWLTDAKNSCNPNTVMCLVGNKLDLEEDREVSFEEGSKFAYENNMIFVETSAKKPEDIEKVFNESINKILELVENGLVDFSSDSGVQKTERNGNTAGGSSSRISFNRTSQFVSNCC